MLKLHVKEFQYYNLYGFERCQIHIKKRIAKCLIPMKDILLF